MTEKPDIDLRTFLKIGAALVFFGVAFLLVPEAEDSVFKGDSWENTSSRFERNSELSMPWAPELVTLVGAEFITCYRDTSVPDGPKRTVTGQCLVSNNNTEYRNKIQTKISEKLLENHWSLVENTYGLNRYQYQKRKSTRFSFKSCKSKINLSIAGNWYLDEVSRQDSGKYLSIQNKTGLVITRSKEGNCNIPLIKPHEETFREP